MPILTRARYVTVKEFQDYYSLKKSTAYDLIKKNNFPIKKVSEKLIRVDISKVDEWMDKQFNQDRRIEEVE
jgi:predicted DNA-binding transcriptional regulator AlpA